MNHPFQVVETVWDWLRSLNTDGPVFVLTVILVFIGLGTLCLMWKYRRQSKKDRSRALLKDEGVRKFDFSEIVGSFEARGVTDYFPITRDDDIREALESRQDIIISGRAGIGKSHAAIYWIREVFQKWRILRIRRQALDSALEDIRVSRKRYVLLLDDLDRFTRLSEIDVTGQLIDLIGHIRDQARKLVVVATIRSTLPEMTAITNHLKEFRGWSHIHLTIWNKVQGQRLAERAETGLSYWDGTPLSVKSPSNEALMRLKRSAVSTRQLVDLIARLNEHGLGQVRADVLEDMFLLSPYRGKKTEFGIALDELRSIGFLKEDGFFIRAYDTYLDRLDIRGNQPDSDRLVSMLEAVGAVDELVEIAEWYLDRDALEEAVTALTIADHLSPEDATTHYVLGRAYARQGHLKDAVQEFNHAASLKPAWTTAWYRLAGTYERLGLVEEGAEAISRALAVDNQRSEDRRLLAIAQFKLDEGEYESALEIYGRLLTNYPDKWYVHGYRGAVLNKLNRWEEAHPMFLN